MGYREATWEITSKRVWAWDGQGVVSRTDVGASAEGWSSLVQVLHCGQV